MLFFGGIEFPIPALQILQTEVKLILLQSIVYFALAQKVFHFFLLNMAAHMENNVIERRDHSRY